MKVRHLRTADDVRGVLRVHANAWQAAHGDLLPKETIQSQVSDPTDDRTRKAFDSLRCHKDRFLVAEDNEGAIRGYAYFLWGDDETKDFVEEHEAYLKEIYVDPPCWGDGTGTLLLQSGLDLLPETTTALTLEVLTGNHVGTHFYETRGFEKTGTAEVEIGGSTFKTTIYTLFL